MKSIRNIAFSALLAVGAFSMVTYTACTKDECKDVTCNNGGTCVSGTCNCTTGYEGTNCSDEVRAKVTKTWTASDRNTTKNEDVDTYSAIITKGTSITEIKIANFSDDYFTADLKATISGNTITVPSQIPDGDGYSVEGTGTYNTTDKKITWTYTVTSPLGAKQNYTGTWN